MREIKFRVWDKDFKQMFYDILEIEYRYDCIVVEGKSSPEALVLSETILMQYTGLKDTNGVEIYEGDVVSYEDSNCEISFHDGTYSMHTIGFDPSDVEINILHLCYPFVEVIGNIYENPELI